MGPVEKPTIKNKSTHYSAKGYQPHMPETRYKLLKDLPGIKAGEVLICEYGECTWEVERLDSYGEGYIKLHPDWFQPLQPDEAECTCIEFDDLVFRHKSGCPQHQPHPSECDCIKYCWTDVRGKTGTYCQCKHGETKLPHPSEEGKIEKIEYCPANKYPEYMSFDDVIDLQIKVNEIIDTLNSLTGKEDK